MLLSVGQVTGYRYLCASERWTDHGTDHIGQITEYTTGRITEHIAGYGG